MREIQSRHVHLDFHTSEFIPNVGKDFDKKQFQEALKLGRVNNINVFAKCHHGYCYYPTKVGKIHPTMDPDFDLTGAMVEAANEIGVDAPIYITVGWSAYDAQEHPEWICRNRDGSFQGFNYDVNEPNEKVRPDTSWFNLCTNTEYGGLVKALTREICQRYDRVDGLWYDIVFGNLLLQKTVCYCEECKKKAISMGYDVKSDKDMKDFYTESRVQFCEELKEIMLSKHKEATVFFNTGGAEIIMPEMHKVSTHFELEDLPTTWGGYDKLPIRAKYFSGKGKPYLGMTGKFHTSWGEFGGFKTTDAMKFECSSILTYGGRISIGDQMHPCGQMDMETYRLIGEAYSYVEQIEEYCFNTTETSRLGVLVSDNSHVNEGVARVLCDENLDFDIVHSLDDLEERFDTIILPDNVCLTEDEAKIINEFAAKGKGILVTGESGLDHDKKKSLLDVGGVYQGHGEADNDFINLGDELAEGIMTSPFLMYGHASQYTLEDGIPLASVNEPYFNRTYGHYCSHKNTPYKLETEVYPGAMQKGSIIYLAHKVFTMYNDFGATFHRKYIANALQRIYKEPVLTCDLPSAGRVRLAKQKDENRYTLHLLYGAPIQRGIANIIEDLIPIYDTKVEIRGEEKIKKIYTVPQKEELSFTESDGVYTFTVPQIKCHQLVVLDYGK